MDKMRELLSECLEILQGENWRGDLQEEIVDALASQPAARVPIYCNYCEGEYSGCPDCGAVINLTQLHIDYQRLVLFKAIRAIEIGSPTDDKLILGNLHEAGYCIAKVSAVPSIAEPGMASDQIVGRVHRYNDAELPTPTEVFVCLNSVGRALPDNAPVYATPLPAAPVQESRPVQFSDEDAGRVVRAFWRRIQPYVYGDTKWAKELPEELPVQFQAHMATALCALPDVYAGPQPAAQVDNDRSLGHLSTMYVLADARTDLSRRERALLQQMYADLKAALAAAPSIAEKREVKRSDSAVWANIVNDLTVQMQAAWIEWQHGAGAVAAMEWIHNSLVGPGLIPNEDEPHGKHPQFWFNAHKSDPFPECFCGNPSSIQSEGEGFCSFEHLEAAKRRPEPPEVSNG